jgi:hypothetical protein
MMRRSVRIILLIYLLIVCLLTNMLIRDNFTLSIFLLKYCAVSLINSVKYQRIYGKFWLVYTQ